MKKTITFILCAVLLSLSLTACNGSGKSTEEAVTHTPAPYSDVEQGTKLSDNEIKTVISGVISDKYEVYPNLKMTLFSATLYRDGKTTSIDLSDSRLNKLINLFLNTVYYDKSSYLQGLLSGTDLADLDNESLSLY